MGGDTHPGCALCALAAVTSAGPVRGGCGARVSAAERRCQDCGPPATATAERPGCPCSRTELPQRTRPGRGSRIRAAAACRAAVAVRRRAYGRGHLCRGRGSGHRFLPDRPGCPLRVRCCGRLLPWCGVGCCHGDRVRRGGGQSHGFTTLTTVGQPVARRWAARRAGENLLTTRANALAESPR